MLLEEVIQAQQAASQFYIKLTLMTGLLMNVNTTQFDASDLVVQLLN